MNSIMFRKRKKGGKKLRSAFFSTPWVLVVLCALFVGSGTFLLWAASLTIPDLRSFEERKISQSTKIYDRTGEVLLFDVHENIKRTIVPLEDISEHIKNATVAIEDAEFYRHGGIKPTSIIRAIVVNMIQLRFSQGGSTITQQVIKNALLTSEKKISRKLKEWVLAVKLEQVMSKSEILALYLNETPYGGSVYGVEEASRAFFGTPAKNLSLAQAAYLAALPQAPTRYSPYGNHTDDLEQRKNLVLEKMLENGMIQKEEYDAARVQTIVFLPRAETGIRAPHFTMYVRDYLEKKYGSDAIEEGGLSVITTLDYVLQAQAEEIVKHYALENKKNFNAENAALVAIDPATGHILAMVGSRDYFDTDIDGNFNVAIAHRQPGSAFKPFVYATAFKKGFTPETVVFDVSTEFSTACTPQSSPKYPGAECYRPGNYDNIFRGPVSLRNALAQSINIPAVKMLYLAGLEDSLRTARDMGITSLTDVGRYGLTLVLGGGEVSPLDMASAYGVFANEGVRNAHTPILRVSDTSGAVIEEYTKNSREVLPSDVAHAISDVLSDNAARAPAFGGSSALYFPGRDVAVKTGTTNNYRDAWIVGYTPNIAVAAWAGNNDNSPMQKKVAGFIVAPLWNAFMQKALATLPQQSFPPAPPRNASALAPVLRGVWQGGRTISVDTRTGLPAAPDTPSEFLQDRLATDVHTILYWINKDNPLGPAPEIPAHDAQFASWEFGVRSWASQNGIVDGVPVTLSPTVF